MTIYQALLLLWLFGTLQWLAMAANESQKSRYQFLLLDELVIACFWFIAIPVSIFKEWLRTRHFPSRW